MHKTVLLNEAIDNLNIKEDGKDVVENALKKARECHDVTGKIAIGMDDSLYLENVPEDEQPGLFVRRVDGKVLEDGKTLNDRTLYVFSKKIWKKRKIKCKMDLWTSCGW